MEADKGSGLSDLSVLSLLYMTVLSGLFPSKYFFCRCQLKVGNIDLTGGLTLLLSFPSVHGARIANAYLCFWY